MQNGLTGTKSRPVTPSRIPLPVPRTSSTLITNHGKYATSKTSPKYDVKCTNTCERRNHSKLANGNKIIPKNRLRSKTAPRKVQLVQEDVVWDSFDLKAVNSTNLSRIYSQCKNFLNSITKTFTDINHVLQEPEKTDSPTDVHWVNDRYDNSDDNTRSLFFQDVSIHGESESVQANDKVIQNCNTQQHNDNVVGEVNSREGNNSFICDPNIISHSNFNISSKSRELCNALNEIHQSINNEISNKNLTINGTDSFHNYEKKVLNFIDKLKEFEKSCGNSAAIIDDIVTTNLKRDKVIKSCLNFPLLESRSKCLTMHTSSVNIQPETTQSIKNALYYLNSMIDLESDKKPSEPIDKYVVSKLNLSSSRSNNLSVQTNTLNIASEMHTSCESTDVEKSLPFESGDGVERHPSDFFDQFNVQEKKIATVSMDVLNLLLDSLKSNGTLKKPAQTKSTIRPKKRKCLGMSRNSRVNKSLLFLKNCKNNRRKGVQRVIVIETNYDPRKRIRNIQDVCDLLANEDTSNSTCIENPPILVGSKANLAPDLFQEAESQHSQKIEKDYQHVLVEGCSIPREVIESNQILVQKSDDDNLLNKKFGYFYTDIRNKSWTYYTPPNLANAASSHDEEANLNKYNKNKFNEANKITRPKSPLDSFQKLKSFVSDLSNNNSFKFNKYLYREVIPEENLESFPEIDIPKTKSRPHKSSTTSDARKKKRGCTKETSTELPQNENKVLQQYVFKNKPNKPVQSQRRFSDVGETACAKACAKACVKHLKKPRSKSANREYLEEDEFAVPHYLKACANVDI